MFLLLLLSYVFYSKSIQIPKHINSSNQLSRLCILNQYSWLNLNTNQNRKQNDDCIDVNIITNTILDKCDNYLLRMLRVPK